MQTDSIKGEERKPRPILGKIETKKPHIVTTQTPEELKSCTPEVSLNVCIANEAEVDGARSLYRAPEYPQSFH